MEERLELRHLAPYLPFGLKIRCKRHYINYGEIHDIILNGINIKTDGAPQMELVMPDDDLRFVKFNERGFKPLLHPLDRLTEPILEGGKKPMYELINGHPQSGEYAQIILKAISSKGFYIDTLPIKAALRLFEWHFDVFGLIEKGLAEPIKI